MRKNSNQDTQLHKARFSRSVCKLSWFSRYFLIMSSFFWMRQRPEVWWRADALLRLSLRQWEST